MSNPLLEPWQTPHGLPPFDKIRPEHYLPAFEAAFAEQLSDIELIIEDATPASFDNTVLAVEQSGVTLHRVAPVFFALVSSNSDDELRRLQKKIVPLYSQHQSNIYGNPRLFNRVQQVLDQQADGLGPEQLQLLRLLHNLMVRQGAGLAPESAKRVQAIDSELASLQTQFGQNVLADSNEFELVLETADLSGLPASVIQAAAAEAARRGKEGQYVFTTSRSSFTPFMQYSERRDLREILWRAYTSCGDRDNEHDNKTVAEQIATLRAERASIMGFGSHAEFVLDDRMAGSPDRVTELLDSIWTPASTRVTEEAATLQQGIQSEGGNHTLAPWDWWHYSEKERTRRFELDAEDLKPYFELERVRNGAFHVAQQLYGLTFTEVMNVPLYHTDAQAFEVHEADGELVGLFITDYFQRPSKKAGAWMNAFRNQRRFPTAEYPIIVNTCNFSGGSPCLLSLDEVRTLFHEFGHGLHGLLSNVTYRSLSGTSVKKDFVELPSQIMEHWAIEPEVLRVYARHYQTDEVIPTELIDKVRASQTFNSGFATTEYLAASYLDLHWHSLPEGNDVQARELEDKAMATIGLTDKIAPRYRSTYFQHIFSGGYSAGYYAYIWAEVLDADAFESFKEKGVFDPATAKSFRENILEKGGTEDPMTLYCRFKGREPEAGPLMKNRGLA